MSKITRVIPLTDTPYVRMYQLEGINKAGNPHNYYLASRTMREEELKRYLMLADSLGMSALVEAHDRDEVKKGLECGARIIGVNNRDLKTFQVDISNSVRLRELVPKEILFVSESGMKTAEDIRILEENGTNAVLIGETLMRSPDKRRELERLRGRL